MLSNFQHFLTFLVFSFFLITNSNSFCSAVVIKFYTRNSVRYIDFDRTPEIPMAEFPEWVNNYSRVLSNENYLDLVKNNAIAYHSSDKSLYFWDPTAHLPFTFLNFFSNLFASGSIFFVILFFFLTLLNIYAIWVVFLSFYQKNILIVFNLFCQKKFYFYFVFWLISEYMIFEMNLITLYPEEWSFAFLLILFIFFLDVFWGACLLDLKIVAREQDAYTFFYGLHFEFLNFFILVLLVLTLILDFLGFIELLGQNEYWTKWD